jgi:hypothetical protein
MTTPRVVTPQGAQGYLDSEFYRTPFDRDLAHTVATEHERRDEYARHEVAKALRTSALSSREWAIQRARDLDEGAPL